MIFVEDCEVRSGEATLLRPVSFTVREGETLVVRGANGAGKSTLLSCLAGTLVPSGGQVLVDGLPADAGAPVFRRTLAACLGTPPMSTDLTIREHLELVALSWYPNSAEAATSVIQICDELGIEAIAQQYPGELSAGQNQLCSLAMTLIRPSRVLVLDEPEHRLDSERVAMLGSVLNRRANAGCALVVATHSEDLTQVLGGRKVELGASRCEF